MVEIEDVGSDGDGQVLSFASKKFPTNIAEISVLSNAEDLSMENSPVTQNFVRDLRFTFMDSLWSSPSNS